MLNIRRSLRSLASRPVFPVVAVATLALGLGVNAAIFSLTREVLLRPLPYRDADRLVRGVEVSRTLGGASAPIAPRSEERRGGERGEISVGAGSLKKKKREG